MSQQCDRGRNASVQLFLKEFVQFALETHYRVNRWLATKDHSQVLIVNDVLSALGAQWALVDAALVLVNQ